MIGLIYYIPLNLVFFSGIFIALLRCRRHFGASVPAIVAVTMMIANSLVSATTYYHLHYYDFVRYQQDLEPGVYEALRQTTLVKHRLIGARSHLPGRF